MNYMWKLTRLLKKNTDTYMPEALTLSEALDSHGDHRVAMALTVLLTLVGGELNGAEAVAKSWPGFFDALQDLGVVISKAEENEVEDGPGI